MRDLMREAYEARLAGKSAWQISAELSVGVDEVDRLCRQWEEAHPSVGTAITEAARCDRWISRLDEAYELNEIQLKDAIAAYKNLASLKLALLTMGTGAAKVSGAERTLPPDIEALLGDLR